MATNSMGWDLDGSNSDMKGSSKTAWDFSGVDFTVGAWILSDDYANTRNDTLGNGTWVAAVNSSNNPRFGVAGVGSRTTSTLTLTDSVWYFFAVNRDNGVDIKFYIITTDGTLSTETESALAGGNGGEIMIGADGGASGTDPFPGIILHTQVWTRNLTQPELMCAAFRPGSVTNGLVGYWPCYGQHDPEPDLSLTNDSVNVDTGNATAVSQEGPPAMPIAGYL